MVLPSTLPHTFPFTVPFLFSLFGLILTSPSEQQIRLDSLKDREDLSKVNIASAKWNDFDPRITITWY